MDTLPRRRSWMGLLAWLTLGCALADEPRTNAFDDPFGQATAGLPGCPVPPGPLYSVEEARLQAHGRAERGTSCYRAGRCRLPNAYLYDRELHPRVVRFIQQDGRFADTSVWITVQRRWVLVEGCVRSREQGLALEDALRTVDDVEAVLGQWTAPGDTPQPRR